MMITHMRVSLNMSVGGSVLTVSAVREEPGGTVEAQQLITLPLSGQYAGCDAQEAIMAIAEELYHLGTDYIGLW